MAGNRRKKSDLEDLEVFRSAKCAVFASTLSDLTGYEIAVITTPFSVIEGGEPEDGVFDEGSHQEDKAALTHVFCVSGDTAVDIDGTKPLSQMIEDWTHGGREGEHFYMKRCRTSTDLSRYTTVFMQEDLVDLARQVIRTSPKKYRA